MLIMSSVAPLNFPPFDVRGDPSSLDQRLAEYVERYNNFLLAMDIKDPTLQRAIFLHFSGQDFYRTFKTLQETGEAKDYKSDCHTERIFPATKEHRVRKVHISPSNSTSR